VFSQQLDTLAQNRVQLDVDLRLAIERSEFFLVYQPRVESVGRALVGCEALVRWKHPRRGTVLPEAFIGAAEASGSIEAIGRMVIDAACWQLAAWNELGLSIPRMSINVSPRQFEKGDLPAILQRGLSRHGLAPALLEIEVTEGLLIGDVSETFRQLETIRALGISVALDDFGTGYSSMSMLASLPYDTMKIDRSFVSAIGSSDRMMAIVRSIVTMASSAGLRLVAEGVESETQADLLRDLGCDELQGYLFGMPMSAEAFHALARTSLATTERLARRVRRSSPPVG
jgi:EAL domain-containing protein (putative c-di-GMP-specific phosphodiesterase class I)